MPETRSSSKSPAKAGAKRTLPSALPAWFWYGGFAALAVAIGAAFLHCCAVLTPDGELYRDLGENLFHLHRLAIDGQGGLLPSSARLPGYPLFLALTFALFGDGNLAAVRWLQVAMLPAVAAATAWLAWLLVRRTRRPAAPLEARYAARAAFALACIAPFLAIFAAAVLTETLATLLSVLALGCALQGTRRGAFSLPWAAATGAVLAAAIAVRPDSGILWMVLVAWLLVRPPRGRHALAAVVLMSALALAPVAAFTVRNAIVLRVFRPLPNPEATEVYEPSYRGFVRWTKTWMIDYRDVEDVVFNVPGDAVDPALLPARAFDDPAQRAATLALVADYNRARTLTPALDAAFNRLAAERIRRAPLRYYLLFPLLRAGALWWGPRVEILPLDDHWWPPRLWARASPRAFAATSALLALNAVFLGLGVWGWLRYRPAGAALLLGWLALRTLVLAAMPTCEPRYTLEAYPVLFVGAALCVRPRPQDSVFPAQG